jgi:DNA-binding transcriptional ArsR family regulator
MTESEGAPLADLTGVTRSIDTPDALKAIADPLRVRLLQLLMVAIHRTWTVKEIAAELGQPVTKLYHHVKLLEAAGLISDVETRMVSGIVEHRYRANQRSLRFDDSMFLGDEARHDTVQQLSAQIDAVRDDLVDYLYRDNADLGHISISRSTVKLTEAELEEFTATVEAMMHSYIERRNDPDRADLPRTSVLFLLNPLGHDPA